MREQAAAILKATEKKDFKCRPDAVEEVKRMRKDPVFKYFTVDVEYTEEQHERWPRGRRGANTKPLEVTTIVRVVFKGLRPHQERVQSFLEKKSCLVLISNVPEERFNDRDLLAAYKGQRVVENNFRQLKMPALGSVIYLKNPDRIKGLVMVLHVALLVRALIELQLRRGHAAWQEAHPGEKLMAGWGSKALTNPTYHQFYDKSKGIYLEKTGYESYVIYGTDDPDYRKALIFLDLLKLDYVKLTERLWTHA